MEIKKILRKGKPLFVREFKISELDKNKFSNKFLSHNFSNDTIVNIKCLEDGTIDLRGKKEEYRTLVPDKQLFIRN